MRNISQKVRLKVRSAILSEFKQVHKQSNRAAAEETLHAFCDKYRSQYPRMVKDLEKIERTCLSSTNTQSRSEHQFTRPTYLSQ